MVFPLLDVNCVWDSLEGVLWQFVDLRAYDRAAIKFRGLDADINFNISEYDEDIKHVSVDFSGVDFSDCIFSIFLLVIALLVSADE